MANVHAPLFSPVITATNPNPVLSPIKSVRRNQILPMDGLLSSSTSSISNKSQALALTQLKFAPKYTLAGRTANAFTRGFVRVSTSSCVSSDGDVSEKTIKRCALSAKITTGVVLVLGSPLYIFNAPVEIRNHLLAKEVKKTRKELEALKVEIMGFLERNRAPSIEIDKRKKGRSKKSLESMSELSLHPENERLVKAKEGYKKSLQLIHEKIEGYEKSAKRCISPKDLEKAVASLRQEADVLSKMLQ